MLALSVLSTELNGADVTWNGSVDSNWNTPGNWSSKQVPGTVPGDQVVLIGRKAAPVVATLVETSNACSVNLSDESLLEVTRSGLDCDEVVLGGLDGEGGGHLMLRGRGDAVMTVSGDLRVGSSPAATTDSSIQLRSGTLTVGGGLYLGKGWLRIFGDSPAIDAKDLTLSSAGTLRFDFNTQTSPSDSRL